MNRLVFVNLLMLLVALLLVWPQHAQFARAQTSKPAPMNSVLEGKIESLSTVVESSVVVAVSYTHLTLPTIYSV